MLLSQGQRQQCVTLYTYFISEEKEQKNVICAIFDTITFKDKITGVFYLKFRVKYFRPSVWYRHYMETYDKQTFLGEFQSSLINYVLNECVENTHTHTHTHIHTGKKVPGNPPTLLVGI